MLKVGNYNPKTGEIEREGYGQGCIFKDEDAFLNRPDEVCYIPELSDEVYTRNNIVSICKGNEAIANDIFYSLDWQCPETEIEALIEIEWIRYDEERDTYERVG
jgi:hypothetical protein